jgi:hypothetical protein
MASAMDIDPPAQSSKIITASGGDKKPRFEVKKVGSKL